MNYFDTLLARKLNGGGGGGGSIYALVTVSTSAGAIVEASDGEGKIKYSAEADNTGTASLQIKKPGTYTLRAKIQNSGAENWIYSDSDSVTVPEYGGQFEKSLTFITLSVTAPNGSEYTITDGTTTMSGTSTGAAAVWYLPNTGAWTVSCTDGTQTASQSVTVSAYTAYSVTLAYFAATITVTAVSGAVCSAVCGGSTYTETAGAGGTAVITVGAAGTYTVSATYSGCNSDTASVTVTTDGASYSAAVSFITLSLTVPQGSTYTLTDGTTTYTGTSTGEAVTYYLPNTGTWTASCTDGEQSASQAVTVSAYTAYTVNLSYVHVYGVIWDKTQTATTLTRTDDAASFANPDPYVADGNHPGSSPFDNIWPWSGMVKETVNKTWNGRDYPCSMVKIPKFWYKIENSNNSLKIQIADGPKTGFKVSPAHQARNENESDRDYVYIGRYKSLGFALSGIYPLYVSYTGVTPTTNVTRNTARESSKNNEGSGFWQQDFAMFWTVRLLYIVEFADWNSQAVIGYGCGNGSSVQVTGASDSMPYHTGTMQSARTTYGVGCQYRWIEDLWGNVREWVDGIYFSGSNIYVITDPENFSDTTGGVNTGTRATSTGFISNLVTGSGDYDWAMYPPANGTAGSNSTYIPDECIYGSDGVAITIGSTQYETLSFGMFAIQGHCTASTSRSDIGSRLMYLPQQS